MKILGIETSSKIGSVAICDKDVILAEQSFEKGMLHGKELIPTIKSIFKKNDLRPIDINLIAVDVGPGSYTGLRVGTTCVKTLSYALNKPAIDVTSLDTISQNVTNEHKYICPILDAQRERVYSCIYKYSLNDRLAFYKNINQGNSQLVTKNIRSFNLWKRVSELLLTSPGEIVNTLPKGTFIFGDGVSRYKKLFEKEGFPIGNNDMEIPKAAFVAILGKHDYDKGRRCDTKTLKPIYLRKPEALEKSKKDKVRSG